ncbi:MULTISPECIES: transporter substrate-binding domain-containing protein [unclassified Pseudomonas]|jgi:polar amino acid transport system substrate-binding protein|uniref:transporter substrate-binding domain-containing protein n=1 Tax=unclassified Pseudomonas TaxID=196821 RepID=UPI00069FF852|nr:MULTISPECIES: transporter substrate-binding domain-containing protein [unclassified Pseudomonas]WPN45253.1 transporter substrate-binding domain-containing protein [Pseudomonas sp. P8_241]
MGNRRFANWLSGAACIMLAGMSAAQAQPIRFAVAAEPYPPYTEKQANGEWKGFEVDLIHKLCSEMKAECEIREVAWDGIIPSLLAKKIDVIFSSMSVTEEREKQIAFSKAYYDSVIAVVGPKDASVKKYPDDLKGKIIGVQNSTVSASYLKTYYEKIADVKYYDTQDSANADLIAGRIDLMMADGTAMAAFVKTPDAKDLAYLSSVPYDPIFGKGVGAGMRKDDAELKAKLDKAIQELLASKDYDELSQSYFGTSVKPAF